MPKELSPEEISARFNLACQEFLDQLTRYFIAWKKPMENCLVAPRFSRRLAPVGGYQLMIRELVSSGELHEETNERNRTCFLPASARRWLDPLGLTPREVIFYYSRALDDKKDKLGDLSEWEKIQSSIFAQYSRDVPVGFGHDGQRTAVVPSAVPSEPVPSEPKKEPEENAKEENQENQKGDSQ